MSYNFSHNNVHIKGIIDSYRRKNQWNNELTIIRAPSGKEYAWNRILTIKERVTMTNFFGFESLEKDLGAKGPIIEIWFYKNGIQEP